MICIYVESYICTFTFIFYSCIWMPFFQTTHYILQIFNSLLNPHDHLGKPYSAETRSCELDLPVSRFQDLEFSSKNRGVAVDTQEEEEEACSICLIEFENEDLVNKVPRCGHVFHMECMEKWLDRCQFTCPLCRSLLLHASSSPCKTRACISAPFS